MATDASKWRKLAITAAALCKAKTRRFLAKKHILAELAKTHLPEDGQKRILFESLGTELFRARFNMFSASDRDQNLQGLV